MSWLQNPGFWMNEPLYQFTLEEAIREDYCAQDLRQAYRRIQELSTETEAAHTLAISQRATATNAQALLQGQGALLDKALGEAQRLDKNKTRWQRFTIICTALSFGAGIYISK
jgi:hemin uptake protein HemP